MIDFSKYDDEALAELIRNAQEELNTRTKVAEIRERAKTINEEYVQAVDRQDGDQWKQPQGSFDAYSKNSVVKHNGHTWDSLVDFNVWEPGVSGWRPRSLDNSPPLFTQPTGAHDAYGKGDQVTYRDSVYESLIDANVWTPEVYPQGWKKIDAESSETDEETEPPTDTPDDSETSPGDDTDDSSTDPEPTDPDSEDDSEPENPEEPGDSEEPADPEPTDPESTDPDSEQPDETPEDPDTGDQNTEEPAEEPPAESHPEWKQPTGGHDAYSIGDRVTFNGEPYESLIGGNVWSPTAYPQGWKKL